jgi:4-aminobutyrate aminotransferase-like enzyme
MDPTLVKATNLTPKQRKEYSKNLMPYHTPKDSLHIKGGQGVYFEDINGKKYLDFTTQMFACYLGIGNEEIAQVIYDQAKIMTVVHPHNQTDLRYSLAHKIATISPKDLNRVAFSVGGGPANEAAMKIALKNVRGSKSFVTMWGAYHGGTFKSVAATFETTRHQAPYGNDLTLFDYAPHLDNNCVRAPHPYCYRCPFGLKPESCGTFCAEVLRQTVINGVMGPLAGIILEPMQSAGGEFFFPKEYLQRAREICDEFGALLIFDEVQCFARSGKWWGAEYFGVQPDIIVFGKGIGGGAPVAGIVIHDRLTPFENIMEDLHTYQNNHIGFAAAIKTLEIIERDKLLENAVKMGKRIMDGFRDIQKRFPEVGDIRGAGLKIGVELVQDPQTREPIPRSVSSKILARALDKGLFLQLTGHSIFKIKPALIITAPDVDKALGIIEEAMKEVLRA